MTLYEPLRSKLCRSCWHHSLFQTRRFHTRPRLRNEDIFPDHYETLGLSSSATTADIKKQFYALSKKHHPDLNPSKNSSQKFVQISEAYHVLGSTTKRTTYDRDYQRIHFPPAARQQHPHGSFSSHQTSSHAGGRPASGLSRRRTQFRGPPPSFYRSGGYGNTSPKRERTAQETSSHSHSHSHSQQRQREAGTPPHGPGGLGSTPHSQNGQQPREEDDPSSPFVNEHHQDVPHWDREAHHRTHETLQQRRARHANESRVSSLDELRVGGSLLWNFLLVCGVMGIATGVPAWWNAKNSQGKERKRGGEKRKGKPVGEG
ncbi:DnaJ-domain-containing protein [Tothia fuscella]|uniref:DnaJ-domain-containing protein n=1 Tax=Tothia fuscella TaxID=1048955 RepID=A0A9P4NTD7_9PEZI|nr:DnaJ-domain-containing protein [Tothia fuscella]